MSAHKALIVLIACALLADCHGAKPDTSPTPAAAASTWSGASRNTGSGAAAPLATPRPDDSPYKFGVRTDLVNVIFTVTDKHGRFIKDLKQNDIKILDNNLPPKQVMNFEAETDLPLRVGLVD